RVGVYYPSARAMLTRLPHGRCESPSSVMADFRGDRLVAEFFAWYDLRDPKDVERAEADLVRSLRKDTDGYLARLDRGISIPISRALTRTAVTPNAVTAASLIVGLLGASLLAVPGYAAAVVGAALLWWSSVLAAGGREV